MARKATTGEAEALRRIEAEHAARTGWLDLGGIGLRRLPPALFELTWLEGLNLGQQVRGLDGEPTAGGGARNRLDALPPDLAPLSGLRRLYLDGNPLTALDSIEALPALQTLVFWGTEITRLDPLTALTALEVLVFSGTGVTDLRPLAGLTALQRLVCASVSIEDLDPIADLSALRWLNVSKTDVERLDALARLTLLEHLDCAHAPIAELAPLTGLRALKHLDCAGTRITRLAPLAELRALQHLDCTLTDVSDLGPVASLTELETLICAQTHIPDLGPVARLSRLQTLHCSGAKVADLGPLAGLSALQALECAGTGVSHLEPLGGLPSLHTLNCSDTKVADLGPVAALHELQTLDCSRTGVADLAPLAGLTRLQTLDCSRTGISDLTPLSGLSELRWLHCSRTNATSLEPIADLPELNELNASWTTIVELPRRLVERPSLRVLCLYATMIRNVPSEVLSNHWWNNSLAPVRAYFTDLGRDPKVLRTTKVIVLGNGRVGKTQLCRRLCGQDYDRSVDSTHGISVASAKFADDETLNIWDFGGQDIYHGTHAIFMRTRAIFVIAWYPEGEAAPTHTHDGMTFENRPLTYWLTLAKEMAGAHDNPVNVVQCRADDYKSVVPPSADSALLQGTEIITYSARTDRRRGTLDDALADAIERLRDSLGPVLIGAGWAKVIERLIAWRADDEPRPPAERKHHVIDRAAFDALCAEVGGVSSPAMLLDYLHHCGLVYYDSIYCEDRVVLDITWALTAIYAIFDRDTVWRHLQATHGRFRRAQLAATVWRDYSDDDQRLFLRLMRSCGICFSHGKASETPGDDAEYIAPDLLPDEGAVANHLAGRWEAGAPTHTLTHDYDFLHPGLFRGLMARIGAAADGTGVYWRTGLWLYAPKTRTRLRIDCTRAASGHGGRLAVQMQGDDSKLADWLRQQIDDQHGRYGLSNLPATVDTLPATPRADARAAVEATADDGAEARSPDAAPFFGPQPPDTIGRRPDEPDVFISYARSDGAPEAEESARVANALVSAMEARGLVCRIDYTDTAVGDSITEFMDRLIEGKYVFAIISDKYLRSESCMYELYNIWERDRRQFTKRLIPIVLSGARTKNPIEWDVYVRHWEAMSQEYDKRIRDRGLRAGTQAWVRGHRFSDYARHLDEILALLNDRLIPRDLARLEATAYAEVINLIRPPT